MLTLLTSVCVARPRLSVGGSNLLTLDTDRELHGRARNLYGRNIALERYRKTQSKVTSNLLNF